MTRFTTAVLLLCVAALPVFADETATAEKAELGQKAPPIEMTDTDGGSFSLHDCRIAKKDAETAVRKAAIDAGLAADASLDTKLSDLPGVKGDDGADDDKVLEVVRAAGRPFGLVATTDSIANVKTLAEVVTWIEKADAAPILLMTWSPRCPTTRNLNDRIVETAAEHSIRIYAVACNFLDTEAMFDKHKSMLDFPIRIFPDREQKVTDILGGKATPHFFLFDKDGTLKYRGGLDNDPRGGLEADEREHWLADAAAAVCTGKDVAVQETAAAG